MQIIVGRARCGQLVLAAADEGGQRTARADHF